MRSRARCRSRRLTRLRVTAGPTALETTKPTRGRSTGDLLGGSAEAQQVDHHQWTAAAPATAHDLTEMYR